MPPEVSCEPRVSPALVRILADMVALALKADAVHGRLETGKGDERERDRGGERVDGSGDGG